MKASRLLLKIKSYSTFKKSHDDDISVEKTKAKRLSKSMMETIFCRESLR